MNRLLAFALTLATAIHAVVGCCAHHVHAVEVTRHDESASAACSHCHQQSASNRPQFAGEVRLERLAEPLSVRLDAGERTGRDHCAEALCLSLLTNRPQAPKSDQSLTGSPFASLTSSAAPAKSSQTEWKVSATWNGDFSGGPPLYILYSLLVI